MEEWSCKRRIQQYLIIMVISWKTVSGQIRYSIPEEMQKGSFVGNIAKDLGVNGKQLSDHGLRIVTSKGMTQYFGLNVNNGHLQISERIDREKICGEAEKCMLKFQVLVENKLKLYSVEVEITDINDNSPQFLSKEWKIEIPETATPTDRFTLPKARDPDLGINSIQNYELTGSNHFSLEIQRGENGARQAELVLDQPLDREEQPIYNLILTAADGGNPIKSAMIEIYIVILDTNDNGPLFSQSIYEVTVKENIPKWSTVATVRATDLDEGINGEVKYFFEDITKRISQMFLLNSTTGEIILVRNLDYEESSWYEFEVQAMDGGGLRNRSKVLVYVMDINDNPPDLVITFSITYVAENTPTGTTVAILNAQDRDSGVNGQVMCSIPSNLPFKLKKMQDDFYTLVTEKSLDREEVAVYNITITAVDEGTPALSTSEIMSLKVLDINDNPPIFVKSSYTSYLLENNPRGASVFCLKANDADWEENGRITYYVIESQIRESLLSSYLSINSETGVVYALNSFDYEEIQEIKFLVKAQDGGSPPLSSNVSVTLFILDENDNAPVILYPSLPTDGSTGIEMAPRSSEPDYLVTKVVAVDADSGQNAWLSYQLTKATEPGYLVTKVVAVDADSGQNAWLSYQLTKATEPGLFTLGLHTGEIRTSRFLLEKDALKQSLVVLVKDNGQPPLSASVTVTVVLANNIPETLSDLSNISAPLDPPSDLTFYLVVAVAFVSCMFLTFLLVLLAIKLYRRRNAQLCESGGVNFSGVPVSQFVGIDGVRAFLQSYCHEVSLTSGSRKSQILFPIASCTNTLTPQQAPSNAEPLLITDEPTTFQENVAVNQVSTYISIFILIS
uniref:Cadherin domain-containing protein n=1 Tax=Anolis carolinensis TaxID=28377 RepID=A0A803TJW0_ANOCA